MATTTKKKNQVQDALKNRSTQLDPLLNPPLQSKPPADRTPPPPVVDSSSGVRSPPQVFRDPNTGKLSGITTSNGNTFLGINPEEVKRIAEDEQQESATPAGSLEVAEANRIADQQRRSAQLASQVGTIDTTQVQNAEAPAIDTEAARSIALQQAIPTAVSAGAATGGAALASTVAAPFAPAAAVAGFGAALIPSLIRNERAAVKAQIEGQIAAANDLPQQTKNLKALIRDTNANPANAEENLQLFNAQLTQIAVNQQKLKLLTQQNAKKYGTNAIKELSDYELFYSDGGSEQYLRTQMQIALLNPDPSKVTLTPEEIEELS